MKSFFGGLLAGVVGLLIVVGLSGGKSDNVLGGADSGTYLVSASTTEFTVGPSTPVMIAATSTGRMYLRITSTSTAFNIGYNNSVSATRGEKLISPLVFGDDVNYTGAIYAINNGGVTGTINVSEFFANP